MNPQFDIAVGLGCAARCGFCVQEVTWKPRPDGRLDGWRDNLTRAVQRFYDLGGRRFVITGGEPTQYVDRMLVSLEVLQQFAGLEFVALYTNGSGLLRETTTGVPLVRVAAERGLTDVNLSCHHYDRERNDDVYRIAGRPSVPDLVAASRAAGLQVRLNLVLQKDWIGSIEELKRYLVWAKSLGVKDVYARGLFWFSGSELFDPMRSDMRNVLKYSAEQRINFEKLLEQIEGDASFDRIKDRTLKNEGQGSEVGYAFEGLPFYLADLTIGQEKLGQKTYWVFMPDGRLYDAFTNAAYEVPLS